MRRQILTVLAGGLLAAGCATVDERPHLYSVAPGAQLTVTEPFTIAAGHGRIRFQDGKPVGAAEFNVWRYSCSLLKEDITPSPYPLAVGTAFEVSAVEHYTDPYTWGRQVQVFVTRLHLASTHHPTITALECESWFEGFFDGAHITLPELAQTLGPYLHLQPKADAQP